MPGKSCRLQPGPARQSSRPSFVPFAGAAVILFATLLAYLPAMEAGFIWDDDVYVTENPLLTAPDGLWRIWFSAHFQSQYFPLVYTTFRFEHALWGFHPFGYHLVNVLLHAANALLVWAILRRLAVPAAWFAAGIFALHPVQVESVAWITELKNTESTLFYLLALWAWMSFTDSHQRGAWRFYALAFLLYALALFSKTTACTFPAAMLLVLWLRHEPIGRRRLAQITPFVAAGLAMGVISVLWESHNFQQQIRFAFGPVARFLVASRALWFYAGKLAWPANLTFSYRRWEIDPHDPAQYLWAIAALALALLLWRCRSTLGRAPLAGGLFFLAALSPVLGFFWLYTFHYSFVADHYQYLAGIGLIAPFAAAATSAARRLGLRVALPFQLPLLILLGVLTWRQATIYRGPETLWRATLVKNPACWMAHNNLGFLLAAEGKLNKAIAHYQDALRLKPDFTDAAVNLGVAYKLLGRNEEALAQFATVLKFNPDDPDARNNLGVVLTDLGRYEEALAHFTAILKLNPRDATACYNAGNAWTGLKRPAEAIAQYQAALRLQPDNSQAHYKLANLLLAQGDAGAAKQHYSAALAHDPNLAEAHYQLAVLLVAQREIPTGLIHYRHALRLKPDWVEPLNNLAWLLATHPDPRVRDGPQALQLAGRAVELTRTNDAESLDTLAAACAETARFAEAAKLAQRAADLAQSAGQSELHAQIIARLQLYQSRAPYRQP